MKRTLLQKILEITQQQEEALDKEDIEAFQTLMEAKQVQIDLLEELHQKQPETKEQKEEALLREIVALDQKNKEQFMRLFEDVKKKLTDIRAKKRVDNVYSNPYDISREEGVFFDKR
ncbi:MAG: hypothetical protein ACRDDX_02110 [Cellulosilyticaceae bacterium]